jgi:hypothetical protein
LDTPGSGFGPGRVVKGEGAKAKEQEKQCRANPPEDSVGIHRREVNVFVDSVIRIVKPAESIFLLRVVFFAEMPFGKQQHIGRAAGVFAGHAFHYFSI